MRIATFNVRGISSETEKQNLIRDAIQYKCDIISLQETKSQSSDRTINGYRMILFDTSCEHYGLGFILSPEVNKTLVRSWKINDRVAVAKFKNHKNKHTIVINIYGPTSCITKNKNDKTRELLYKELEILTKEHKNDIIYITGDLNSKIGRKTDAIENCLGSFSKGKRNENGQALLEFCLENNLFIANSAFKHKSRHITTWQGQIIDKKTGQVIKIFNQIDFVIVQQRYKHHLTDARSYAGTLVNSDHRLVIATSNTDNHIYPKKVEIRKSRPPKHNVESLQNPETKRRYQHECNNIDGKINEQSSPKERQTIITNTILQAANKTLTPIDPKQKHKTPCPIISKLSAQQKQLRLQIDNCNETKRKEILKKERNSILHQIRHQALENASNRIDKITEEIESTPDSHKMFEAVRIIQNKRKIKPIIVHDTEGKTIENDEEKLAEITKYMRNKYSGQEKIDPFPNKGPLQSPIISMEVTKAIQQLNNNRASGLDDIKGEHLKALHPNIIEMITDMFNAVHEQSKQLDICTGNLLLLQKPNKPVGPMTNLRPIVLLSTFRKLLSIITLNRIRAKIEEYLSPSQAGFRRYRSTSDIVFTHKWLIGRIHKYKEEFTILGIDMSSAFDTIDRGKLIKILETILNDDDMKLIRIILADTELNINIGQHSQRIDTIIGTPQGDCISPVLFIVYLEGALRHLRPKLPPTNISPRELIYADDADLIFNNKKEAEETLETIMETLMDWNLKVNASKTEYTQINKTNEEWKNTRKLGTLLGDSEELERRKKLAIVAFKNMTSIFIRRHKISEDRRMRLYDALILPILTYNCSTWALTEAEIKSLNAFHRKQLRILIGIFYPNTISNKDLYTRCKTNTISSRVTKQRWQLFGHILRREDNIPAQLAMDKYFDQGTKFRGRPTITLPTTIDKDVQLISHLLPSESIANDHTYTKSTQQTSCHQLKEHNDLKGIRNLAQNRELWQKLGHELMTRREAIYAKTL